MARELARAHIHGPGPQTGAFDLANGAARITGALARTPAGETLAWRSEIPPGLIAAADKGDVPELLGTLLGNAAKWARSEIRISAHQAGRSVVVQVEDNGPGIPPQDRRAALTRGVRLDPAPSGTGPIAGEGTIKLP